MSNTRKSLDPSSFSVVLGRMLESSTLTSGFIAILLVVGVLYCIAAQIPAPDTLNFAFFTIIGYFFGSKGQDAVVRGVKAAHESSR